MTKTSVVVVAAGGGSRSELGYNKIFYSPYLTDVTSILQGNERVISSTILHETLKMCLDVPSVSQIVLVISEIDLSYAESVVAFVQKSSDIPIVIALGGETRTDSVRSGLTKVARDAEIVAIHDGDRPYTDKVVFERAIDNAVRNGACVVASLLTDAIYSVEDERIVDRNKFRSIGTPQCFRAGDIMEAYACCSPGSSYVDDSSLYSTYISNSIRYIINGKKNTKITYPYHLTNFAEYIAQRDRFGFDSTLKAIVTDNSLSGVGFDCHKLVVGRKLMLGGVDIPYHKGCLGHSDGDVVLHALMDAMLTAAGMRDIGVLFPDTDPAYKDIDSSNLLARVSDMLKAKGIVPSNASVTIITERPKLSDYIPAIAQRLANILEIPISKVGVSATTSEGLGITDGEQAVASIATVSLKAIRKS